MRINPHTLMLSLFRNDLLGEGLRLYYRDRSRVYAIDHLKNIPRGIASYSGGVAIDSWSRNGGVAQYQGMASVSWVRVKRGIVVTKIAAEIEFGVDV